MSDILGHDVDGRPLRAGDEVVVLVVRDPKYNMWLGSLVTVFGPASRPGTMAVDVPAVTDGRTVRVFSGEVRKLDNHRPANESFHEMIKNLKQVTA